MCVNSVNMYFLYVYVIIYIYKQLYTYMHTPNCPSRKNLEISLGEGFRGSRGDAAFSLCLG